LLAHAVQVVDGMRAMTRAAGLDPYREGTLRLGLSETLASTILIEFVRVFSAQYPKAKLDIIVNSSPFQRDELLDRALDLALLMGPVSHPEITNLDLISFDLIWVAAADHPLANTPHVTLEDLADVPVISYSTTSRPYLELAEKLRAAGLAKPRLFSSNALGASVAIAGAGLALSTTPRVYAQALIDAGDLVEINAPVMLSPLRFTASYRSEPGEELASSAARIAIEVAQRWTRDQSSFAIVREQ